MNFSEIRGMDPQRCAYSWDFSTIPLRPGDILLLWVSFHLSWNCAQSSTTWIFLPPHPSVHGTELMSQEYQEKVGRMVVGCSRLIDN